MAGLGLQRKAGGLAIEQAAFAQRRLQARAEIVRRPGQRSDDRRPADDTRIDRLDLRHVDPRVDVDLVVGIAPVEPRRPARALRHKVGEAETSARHRPRRAGHLEIAAGDLVEERVAGDEFRRARVDRRIQFAIARRAVELRGETRLPFERGPGEQTRSG